MASSTSLEGDLDTTITRTQQHKHLSRSRQRARSKHQQHPDLTMSSNASAFDHRNQMGSNGVSYTALEADQKMLPNRVSSAKNKNVRHKRNLREKRRPTGIVHIISTESAGGTSSETEEEGLDDDLNAKKNTQMNEIVFLPMPTAHLRALAAHHASSRAEHSPDEDQDEDQDGDDEDVLEDDCEETRESAGKEQHSNIRNSIPVDDMRTENERLRDQLKFKDKYIKQLEARVFQLEIHQRKQHNPLQHSNSPKKRNQ